MNCRDFLPVENVSDLALVVVNQIVYFYNANLIFFIILFTKLANIFYNFF